MGIYFEPRVVGLHGHLISGSNPVGLVCPGGWQHALSGRLCGVFIKCEESGGNEILHFSIPAGEPSVERFQKPSGSRGHIAVSHPASLNFPKIVDPH